MSTNYYMQQKPNAEDNGLHLGKRSAGWRFTFVGDADLGVVDYESWKDVVCRHLACGLKVVDEYGVVQNPASFFRMAKEWGLPDGKSCVDFSGGGQWLDKDGNSFYSHEFC